MSSAASGNPALLRPRFNLGGGLPGWWGINAPPAGKIATVIGGQFPEMGRETPENLDLAPPGLENAE
jgi:hypothetical protein